MACEPFKIGATTGIVCTRGKRPPEPCEVPGCTRRHVALCDYPLTAAAKSRTCDKRLCADHLWRVPGRPLEDYCPAHRKMYEQAPRADIACHGDALEASK